MSNKVMTAHLSAEVKDLLGMKLTVKEVRDISTEEWVWHCFFYDDPSVLKAAPTVVLSNGAVMSVTLDFSLAKGERRWNCSALKSDGWTLEFATVDNPFIIEGAQQ